MGKHTRPLTSASRLVCGVDLHFGPHTMRADYGVIYWSCGNCDSRIGGPPVTTHNTYRGTTLAAVSRA